MTLNISTDALPQAANEATILLNVGTNDPTRGDVAGWRGMARGMAAKTGARVVYADDKTVRSAFGDDQDTPYQELLAKYIEEFNPPEAVFGHSCHKTLSLLGQDPNDVYEMTRINEGITGDLLGEHELVAHHLTDEVVAEEGVLFDEKHPNIKKPIITVMLQDPYGGKDRKAFAERIVKVMSHYPEATIYLCGSRHTSEDSYNDLQEKIIKETKKQRVSKKIDVTGYKFDREAKYNPYKGLIARSKHIVVWASSSQSLVSEALFSGKTVYLHGTHSYSNAKKKGLATNFNELALDEAPLSQEFEPFNLTDQLVEKLMEQKDTKDTDVDKRVLQRADTKRREEWDTHLRAIRRNHKAAAAVPEALKKDREFVRAAIKVRGFSLCHFPDFQDDRDIVATALGENQNAIKFIGKALQGFKGFIQDLMSSVNSTDAFAAASEELRSDPAFAKLALSKDRSAFAHVPDDLKKDPDFIRDLVKDNLIRTSDIPDEMMQERDVLLHVCAGSPSILQKHDKYINDPEFATEAIELNPACYSYFGYDVRKVESIAIQAISADCAYYQNVPTDERGNKAIISAYLAAGGAWQSLDVQHIDDDLVRELMPVSPKIIAYGSDELKNDRDLARIAIEAKDAQAFQSFSDEVRDDPAIILPLIEDHHGFFKFAGPKTRGKYKIAKKAVFADPELIHLCSDKLQGNVSFVRSFIAKHPEYFAKLPEESKLLKGIEEYAVKKEPQNLAHCSVDFRKQKKVIDDVITQRPEHFKYLGPDAQADYDNIRRIFDSGSEEGIKAISTSALRQDPKFFEELLRRGPAKNTNLLISSLRYRDDFCNSRRMVLCAAAYAPEIVVTNALSHSVFRNADFMRQIAAIDEVKAEHFEYVDFLGGESVRAMIEVRPEFLEHERLRNVAFSRYDHPRLCKEEQAKARKDARLKLVKDAARTISDGAASFKNAFAEAVQGLLIPRKGYGRDAEVETLADRNIRTEERIVDAAEIDIDARTIDFQRVSETNPNRYPEISDREKSLLFQSKKSFDMDPETKAKISKMLKEGTRSFENKTTPLRGNNSLAKKIARTYKSDLPLKEIYTEPLIDCKPQKEYIKKFYHDALSSHEYFNKISKPDYEHYHHFDGDHHDPFHKPAIVPPQEDITIEGQAYKLVERPSPYSLGITDWLNETLSKDLSDNSRYPDGSIVRFVNGTSDEVAVYRPVTAKAEHSLRDGTICGHYCVLSRKHVEQVGGDIWVRASAEDEPIVIKNAVIGPANDNAHDDVVGIYIKTNRKVEPKAENKPEKGFKKR